MGLKSVYVKVIFFFKNFKGGKPFKFDEFDDACFSENKSNGGDLIVKDFLDGGGHEAL